MATRTFRGTVNSNWNLSTNWLELAIPTGLDDVIFDALSPNCIQDTATGAAMLTITTTGYNGTINLLYNITVSSTVILSSTTTLSGVGIFRMVMAGTTTVTSNGATTSCDVLFNGNVTCTLGSNWTITGDVTCNGSSLIINGNTITCSSNISFTGGSCSGTTSFIINGTGTWAHSAGSVLRNSLTINTAGTITISGNISYNTGILTYTAGTVVTSGSTLSISASTTLDTDRGATKITWNNVTLGATITLTLTTALNINGTFIPCTGGVTVTINTSTVNISGNLSVQGTGGIVTGTSLFNINGTGTWSYTSSTILRNNLTINTAGTITISGTVNYNTGTLTYTAGTVITTGSTLTIGASTTLNTNGITWNNITLITTQTLTLGSNLNLSGTFAILGTSQTFTVNGFTINTGGLATNVTTSILTGTTSLVFNGTGTHTGSASTSIRIPITINTSGTLTFASSSLSLLQGCILTYIAGTLVIPSTFTWVTTLSNTFNTPGVSWANFFLNGGSTVTINALLTAIKIEANGSGNSFIGTSGFNTGTFMFYQAGGSSNTLTLKSGLTYNVTTTMSNTATAALTNGLVSSTPGTKAILTLSQGATQNLDFCNATDIDSSAGLTIWSYKGVLSNATNWNEMSTIQRAISYIN